MIGYKKVLVWDSIGVIGEAILTLEIPGHAQIVMHEDLHESVRSLGLLKKCRASEAKVIAAEMWDGRPIPSRGTLRSSFDSSFQYEIGETVTPQRPFDPSIFVTCTSGIHFFQTKKEAQEYLI